MLLSLDTPRCVSREMPPVLIPNLWQNKVQAIQNLEGSLAKGHPRALIQMATRRGQDVARDHLALSADQIRRPPAWCSSWSTAANLGEQAEKEFQNYRTPDDNRKFTELYPVQRLTTNTIAASSKVVITTIQRLYSMLKGEPDLPSRSRRPSRSSRTTKTP